jgi:hypothetical protein
LKKRKKISSATDIHRNTGEDSLDNEENEFWNCNMHTYVYISLTRVVLWTNKSVLVLWHGYLNVKPWVCHTRRCAKCISQHFLFAILFPPL